MKKISGNKLFVKALKEEGVEILFGYPGATIIDIGDELLEERQDMLFSVLKGKKKKVRRFS